MRFTNKEITIEISERLQNQITWLCSNVSNTEWSGTLFYRIKEGSLDQAKCVIVAEYVYLQDIGSSAYTEYSFKPDYTTFLMNNPEFLEMNSGHIHSHHSMAVFFSGTDDDELVTNSEFHNYYLSLIVNNRNDMTAKVAFRYTKKMNINSVIKHRNSDGQFVTSELQAEEREVELAGFHDCTIVKPNIGVDEQMLQRFKVVEEESKSKKASTPGFFQTNHGKGGINNQDWMYEPGKGWVNKASQGNLFEDNKKNHKKFQKHKQNHKTFSKEVGRLDLRMSSFLTKLLNLDHLSEETITNTMRALNNKLNTTQARLIYGEALSARLDEFYIGSYPEDTSLQLIENRVMTCMDFLQDVYKSTYPLLVNEILDSVLSNTIK